MIGVVYGLAGRLHINGAAVIQSLYCLTEKVRSSYFLRHAYLEKTTCPLEKVFVMDWGRKNLAAIQGGIGVLFRLAGPTLRLDYEGKGFYTSHAFSGGVDDFNSQAAY